MIYFITPSAVRQWMEIRKIAHYESALGELIRVCRDADERRSPKRSGSGLLVYRVRRPVDVQFIVSTEGPGLPQLVAIRRVQH